MPRIPTVSAKKLIKVLEKKEFSHYRTSGSHHIYIRQSDQARASIPVHHGKDLGRGLTVAILKDAGITPREFLELL